MVLIDWLVSYPMVEMLPWQVMGSSNKPKKYILVETYKHKSEWTNIGELLDI